MSDYDLDYGLSPDDAWETWGDEVPESWAAAVNKRLTELREEAEYAQQDSRRLVKFLLDIDADELYGVDVRELASELANGEEPKEHHYIEACCRAIDQGMKEKKS